MERWAPVLAVVVLCAAVAVADHDIAVPYVAAHGSPVVDGDLGDWAGADWIALDELYSGGAADVAGARYCLRWNDAANLLYFAVEVTDAEQNLQPAYTTWNGHDDVEISVDAGNNTIYFQATMTKGQQIVFGAAPDGGDWVIASWSNPVGTDLVPEFAVVADGTVIRYEGAIVPYSHYSGWSGDTEQAVVDLEADVQLGFDVVAVTKLNDSSYGMLANNLVGGKFQQGSSLQKWTLAAAGGCNPGDADGDGDVDLDDFVILKNNFGTAGATYAQGDFDLDGDVDLDDFVLLKNNFGTTY
ncbi:MAG: hypothetical protein GX591_06325 [Planctomycetes bacterium]|nr:hypothetical protein [Planctomycetota bacterium]